MPGAISAAILLSDSFAGPVGLAVLVGILVLVIAITYAVFLLAERVDGFLGETGRSILTRLLGVILAALAVQFVSDGAKALFSAG